MLFKNLTEKEARWLVSDFFLLFNKALKEKSQVVSQLLLIYFARPRLGHTIKIGFITFQTVSPEVCSLLIFHKMSATSFSANVAYGFSRKIFLMLHSIN